MRTFLDFDTIYQQMKNDYQTVLNQLEQELENVKDESNVVLKDNFAIITGTVRLSHGYGGISVNYPNGFSMNNCVPISVGMDIVGDDIFSYFNQVTTDSILEVRLTVSSLFVYIVSVNDLGGNDLQKFKIVLMKTN